MRVAVHTGRRWVKLAAMVTIAAPMLGFAREPVAKSWGAALSRLKPVFHENSSTKPEITGKVVTGYQGWFGAEGDGSGLGWWHYGGAKFGPGRCNFEMWPPMVEADDDEKFGSPFSHDDEKRASCCPRPRPELAGDV